jgi:2-desacetyl-2-hydroxyethyl bacteriochlorophyllide A dehydrogenase
MEGRAAWFASARQVEIRTETVPPPGPGDVTVASEISLISAGTEMLVYRGECTGPEDLGLDRPGRAGSFPFPVKYGYQLVGRVFEAGDESGFSPGQRVFVNHPHQDLLTIPVRGSLAGRTLPLESVFLVPEDLPSDTAVLAHLFTVALNALLDTPVRPGECVVVSGLGIVGSFVAYLARLTASRLILIDPVQYRREAARVLGADAVVAPQDASATIAELTGGRGADLHFEASGAPAALQAALQGTARDGTVTVVASYGAKAVPLVLSPEFHNRRLRLFSSQGGGINPELSTRWSRARRMAVAFEYLHRPGMPPIISRRYPFARAADAYRQLDERRDEVLGVALTYGQGGSNAESVAVSAKPAADELR